MYEKCYCSHDDSGEEVVYYSTAPQMHELVTRLDDVKLEFALCRELKEHLPAILDQMFLTMEVYTFSIYFLYYA